MLEHIETALDKLLSTLMYQWWWPARAGQQLGSNAEYVWAQFHDADGQKMVLIFGMALFSVILPAGIVWAKIIVRDTRVEVARRLSRKFPALATTYSFRFAVAKYSQDDLRKQEENKKSWEDRKQQLREFPEYILPATVYAIICFCGFYTALMVSVFPPPSAPASEKPSLTAPVTTAQPGGQAGAGPAPNAQSIQTTQGGGAAQAPPAYQFDNYLIYGMRAFEQRVPASPPSSGEKQGATAPVAGQPVQGNQGGGAVQLSQGGASQNASTIKSDPKDVIEQYGKGTIAVSVAAFIGSYLWTLIFLARRVTNFDLSPFSFIHTTIQIALACFVCIFMRHLYDAGAQLVWPASPTNPLPANSSWLLPLAFLIGFYPALGLNYLQERFAFLRFKTRNAAADALAREMPLDMVDGIDSYIKFRLGEYEIEDVENLALANSIQLFIETPYSLRKIIDWMGQAQLMIEIDNSKIAELRNLGIRTSMDFLCCGETEDGRKLLQSILHPMQTGNDTKAIQQRLRIFAAKQHVRSLCQIINIIANDGTPVPVRDISLNTEYNSLTLFSGRIPATTVEARKGSFVNRLNYRDSRVVFDRFSGKTAWERHRNGNEIVQVVAGSGTLHIYEPDEEHSLSLTVGEMVIVPQNSWHRFEAPEPGGVCLMTIGPTEVLFDQNVASDPRQNRDYP